MALMIAASWNGSRIDRLACLGFVECCVQGNSTFRVKDSVDIEQNADRASNPAAIGMTIFITGGISSFIAMNEVYWVGSLPNRSPIAARFDSPPVVYLFRPRLDPKLG